MTTAQDLGERRIIQHIMKHLSHMPGTILPNWEDASALSLGDGRALVVNTDMLVWQTDIPKGMTSFQAARKSVVMTISDLGAKGVQPIAFMPSIAVPRNYEVSEIEELSKGFEKGAKEYDSYVIGGDTNEACDIIINGIALGIGNEEILMKRNGAVPGDVLATTGSFGETSAAFKILLEGYRVSKKLKQHLVESVFMPKARIKEGIALAKSGIITSCIDSSDGLSISLHDLKRSTGFGYKLTSLPISKEAEKFASIHNLNKIDLTLYGGEEYELIFTVKPNKVNEAKSVLNQTGSAINIIGEVVSEKRIWLETDSINQNIPARGWDHFIK